MGFIGPDQEAVARFGVGQVVHHRMFGYRGVVVDVDPCFLGSDEWYDQITRSNPPKDAPWYHVLVDGQEDSAAHAYVAERNLVADDSGDPVDHPLLEVFFDDFVEGSYHRPLTLN